MLGIVTGTTKHKKTRKPGSAEGRPPPLPTCIHTQLWMLAERIRQTKAIYVLDIDDDNEITTFQHYVSTYILY
jgi:hypothetical protein